MSNLVPTIYELPVMNFGGGPLYLLADFTEGARAMWSPAGGLEVLHTAVLPIGSMAVVVSPEHARHFRPLKYKPVANALELPPAPYISVGPVEIPVMVDAVQDYDATITRGVVPGGERIPTPAIPEGSLVCLIQPELAARIRPLIARAIAAAQQQLAQQRSGGGGSVLH